MKIVIKPSKAAAWQMNTQLSIQLKLLSPMWKPSSLIYLLIKRVATFCTCEIQRGFWAKTQGCIAHQEQALWSSGPFWNKSSSQEATTAPQLCVRQAQQRSACAREWSSQQENLQRSVLNCSVLLPHHIYKILNRRAPAVAFHSFLLLISSSDWSHRYRSLLSSVCPVPSFWPLTLFLINV